MEEVEPVDMSVIEGAGCDNKTARYELFAIITHQGRTAEGGHYVAWVKKDKAPLSLVGVARDQA